MYNEKHDLIHELPEYKETIHDLKINNNHFAQLFDQYHDMDNKIRRIETGIENTSDEYLEVQKKQRLHLKDKLFKMIQSA